MWRSVDRGVTWDLVNPGCLAPQPKAGRGYHGEGDQCQKDADCYGDADCVADGNTGGRCVCNVFQRESHALTVDTLGGYIYIYGGFVDRRVHTCGSETPGTHPRSRKERKVSPDSSMVKREPGKEFACGGGFRGYIATCGARVGHPRRAPRRCGSR